MGHRIVDISVGPLSVPLREPFVIASGRIDATRAVLVKVVLEGPSGSLSMGLGEAAALPPVTREDQPDLLTELSAAAVVLSDAEVGPLGALDALLDDALPDQPVARAGLECALLDALARYGQRPLCELLAGAAPRTLTTDMTLPIGEPEHMAELAVVHRRSGFNTFKVKVGKSIDDDLRALELVAQRVPDARFRVDANGGYSADEALALLAGAERLRLRLECFEQPCARADLAGMAAVTAATAIPVVADESVASLADLAQVQRAGAASGVNLKLVKSGGMLRALSIGQRARALGMPIMCGGMVETRLGMTAMGHVACALGGVEFVDLDTAFLLAQDPFRGGYTAAGAELTFSDSPGLGIEYLVG